MERKQETNRAASCVSNSKSSFRAKGFHYEWQLTLRMLQHIRRVSGLVWPAQSNRGFLFCCVNISVPGLSLKQIQKVSVALGLHFCVRHEAEGGAVDAVAHTVGRLRIAGEHMTQMGVTGTPRMLI